MYVPLVLTGFLDRAAELYAGKTAAVDGERTVTYGELQYRVNQLSNGLKALNVKKGDKVAYLSPNAVEMLEGFYGVFQLGAVMTPLNTRLTAEDYEFILNHSESKVLFADKTLFKQLEPILDNLTSIETIVLHGEEEDTKTAKGYEGWLSQFDGTFFDRAEVDEHDIASLLYTSGTTGNPKGVLLTHRSNYLHALSTMHHLRIREHDKMLHVLPMFHVNGWGSPFYYTANGVTQIMQRKIDPKSIFDNIKEHQINILHMAPTVLNMLLEYYHLHKEECRTEHPVRIVVAGSAPPPAFIEMAENELGWEFIHVYGMTEISPLVTTSQITTQDEYLSKEEQQRLKAKTGYPLIGSEVKVVNEVYEEVKKDGTAVGEIVVRSNNVMEGYFKNPEATAETIQHGWLHTGDMAVVFENGYIEIVDRKKDVIISGGENISSIEVEGYLYHHPDIVETAVVALPHEKWGEIPHAVVVKREDSSLTEEDVINFAREKMAHFKAPKSISFVKELPKTASGKIQKVQIRKQLWNDSDKLVN